MHQRSEQEQHNMLQNKSPSAGKRAKTEIHRRPIPNNHPISHAWPIYRAMVTPQPEGLSTWSGPATLSPPVPGPP
eukprot:3596398-Pyramimonas_sp.AAC.1